jgi:hypothetical protein
MSLAAKLLVAFLDCVEPARYITHFYRMRDAACTAGDLTAQHRPRRESAGSMHIPVFLLYPAVTFPAISV